MEYTIDEHGDTFNGATLLGLAILGDNLGIPDCYSQCLEALGHIITRRQNIKSSIDSLEAVVNQRYLEQ